MPAASDLDALLPAIIADLAKERGHDQPRVPPLHEIERRAHAYWRGGPVRRLHRTVEAFLHDRGLGAAMHWPSQFWPQVRAQRALN
jgi:hypothetical protein